jgi:hypothetical protein
MDDEFEKNMKKCGGMTSVWTSVVAAFSSPAVVDASLVASGSSYGNATIDDSNGKKDVFIATYIANIDFRLLLILFLLFYFCNLLCICRCFRC